MSKGTWRYGQFSGTTSLEGVKMKVFDWKKKWCGIEKRWFFHPRQNRRELTRQ